MAFVPFEKYTIITDLSQDVLLERLFLNVDARQKFSLFSFSSNNSTHSYEGEVNPHDFDIRRVINYRNSFIPNIKGTITAEHVGCKVAIFMMPNIGVMVFMGIWLSGALFGGIMIIIDEIENGRFGPLSPLGLLMFVFGYLMLTGGFKYESVKSKKFLNELFEAQEV